MMRWAARIAKWALLACAVAALAGSASAFFLLSLDAATQWRETHSWVVWLLPCAGFAVGWIYLRVGRSVEAGNNLLIEEVHEPRATIPLRMAPMILGTTVVSHLFGASVGREGTAVQMGGALADQLPRPLRLDTSDRRTVLMMGMAAGFASVFGTPWAGAIFAIEVLTIGRLHWSALLPCAAAAWLADRVCAAWGAHHMHYAVGSLPEWSTWTVFAVLMAGALCGLTAMVFGKSGHAIARLLRRCIAYAPLRPAAGGLVVATAAWALNAHEYLGLGLPTLARAFEQPLAPWAFAEKLLFTVVSLGSGFKGGEVTPLFFIGATLGNALAPLLDLPLGTLAGIGLAATFAGATNTPIATTVLAAELFGIEILPFAALACAAATLCSGHAGIYAAQRTGRGKPGGVPPGLRLSELAAWRRSQRGGKTGE